MVGGYRASGEEDENALPWLEPAEIDEDEAESRFPYSGLIVAGFAVVAVVAVLWFVAVRFGGARDSDAVAATDEVPLIQAPDGPYKVRPENPGGLNVDADSMTHAVAEGNDPGGEIAIDSMPEEPVPVAPPPVRRISVPEPRPQPVTQLPVTADAAAVKRAPSPVEKKPVTPAPAPTTTKPDASALLKTAPGSKIVTGMPQIAPVGTVTVQLGAFSSAAIADQVWSKLAGKVSALSTLAKRVIPVEVGGKTLYRLRASGIGSAAQASTICAQVQAAGEQCAIVK